MSETTPNVDDVMAEMAWWDAVTAAHEVTRLRSALAAARREVETVNEEAERQAGVICNLNTDLATSRAALEDVRRVEAWMEDYPDGRYVDVSRGWFCMVDVRRGDDEDVPAESIAALGRALAQEAGDAMR